MEIRVIAGTIEKSTVDLQLDFKLLAGKAAGVCYMPDDYLSQGIQDEDKAIKRAGATALSGHHSVYDHAHLTLTIDGIPKMLAMLLNSTGDYVTSEKSARYTKMQPETELEVELYNKWLNLYTERISEVYPNIDERSRLKLAMENARYLISVFTPTTMLYTASHRQFSYILGWLPELSEKLTANHNPFNDRLNKAVKEFYSLLSELIQPEFTDIKGREFDFIPQQYGHLKSPPDNVIANAYTYSYVGSFAQLAQAHRHRTLSYTMWFKGDRADEYGFYVPPILRNTALEAEWLRDIESIGHCFPQGTLVMITEEGLAKHFFLKCKERLCGRAQLEIALQTASTLEAFLQQRYNFERRNRDTLQSIAPKAVPVAKCGMKGFICKEVCMWGNKNWHNRQI